MSLIKCYECGAEISDKSLICPNCGAPQTHQNNNDAQTAGSEEKDNVVSFCIKKANKNSIYAALSMFAESLIFISSAIILPIDGIALNWFILIFWLTSLIIDGIFITRSLKSVVRAFSLGISNSRDMTRAIISIVLIALVIILFLCFFAKNGLIIPIKEIFNM